MSERASPIRLAEHKASDGSDEEFLISSIIPFDDIARGALRRISTGVLILGVFVLILACANVSSVLLAWIVSRRQEFATRLALGATRVRLAALIVGDTLPMVAIGFVAAIAVATIGERIVERFVFPDARLSEQSATWKLMFSGLSAIAAGAVVAIAPVARGAGAAIGDLIRQGSGTHDSTFRWVRRWSLMLQSALATILLIASIFFLRALKTAVKGPGFDVDNLFVLEVETGDGDVSGTSVEEALASAERVLHLDRSVASTAIGVSLPLRHSFGAFIRVPGRDSIPRLPTGGPYVDAVSSTYAKTLGLALIRGRFFNESDMRLPNDVMLVNQTAAGMLWPAADPIGRCVIIARSPACKIVVGILRDIRRESLVERPTMQLYVPLSSALAEMQSRVLFLRLSRSGPRNLLSLVARAGAALPPGWQPTLSPMAAFAEPELRVWRSAGSILTGMGILALAIAAFGSFTIIACFAAERKRELGVRAALGASPRDNVWLLVSASVRDTTVGTIAGAALVLTAGRLFQPKMLSIGIGEPRTVALAAAVLVGCVVLAALPPAVRAARTSLASAMRDV